VRLRAALSSILAIAGGAVVVKAATVPYAQICDAWRSCANMNTLPSLLDDQFGEVSWLVAEPALALLLTLVAALALLVVRRPAEKAVAAGIMTVAGALTFAFFIGLLNMHDGTGRGGPIVGAAGALIITIAGVAAAAGALRAGTHSQ
jgi:hypothetical protein